MFKKWALLIWVFLLLGGISAAQQGDGLIKGIFLIKNPTEKFVTPPLEIRIGINMATPAYYKLSEKDVILCAGLFPIGVNSLSIPAESFFEKTAKHTFLLELKTEQGITRKDIILDIQLAIMESPIKMETEQDVSEHKLSLYIENQLVSTRIKQQEIIPSIQPEQKVNELAPIPQYDDPFYVPKESDDLMTSTVSIFDALGLAYHLVKSITRKKDRGEPAVTLQHTHSFSIKFLKKNSQGVEKEVIAMIGLTTK